jgi:putative transposase
MRVTGHLWQGRFSSVAMDEAHLHAAFRYVALNPVRARLAVRAEDWRWSSLWRRVQTDSMFASWLSDWPMERQADWTTRVNRPHTASELEALRVSVQRGRPFGDEGWVRRVAKRFGMGSTLRPRGRPKGS